MSASHKIVHVARNPPHHISEIPAGDIPSWSIFDIQRTLHRSRSIHKSVRDGRCWFESSQSLIQLQARIDSCAKSLAQRQKVFAMYEMKSIRGTWTWRALDGMFRATVMIMIASLFVQNASYTLNFVLPSRISIASQSIHWRHPRWVGLSVINLRQLNACILL